MAVSWELCALGDRKLALWLCSRPIICFKQERIEQLGREGGGVA